MALDKRTEYTVALLGLLVPIITGTLWVGSVAGVADNADTAVHELKNDLKTVPADIAVLKAQAEILKEQLEQIRLEQKAQNEALLAAIKARTR